MSWARWTSSSEKLASGTSSWAPRAALTVAWHGPVSPVIAIVQGATGVVRAALHLDRAEEARTKAQAARAITRIGGIGNGASHNPDISDAGQFVLFDSDATNLRPSR